MQRWPKSEGRKLQCAGTNKSVRKLDSITRPTDTQPIIGARSR